MALPTYVCINCIFTHSIIYSRNISLEYIFSISNFSMLMFTNETTLKRKGHKY